VVFICVHRSAQDFQDEVDRMQCRLAQPDAYAENIILMCPSELLRYTGFFLLPLAGYVHTHVDDPAAAARRFVMAVADVVPPCHTGWLPMRNRTRSA
jgi:hypothetical protein